MSDPGEPELYAPADGLLLVENLTIELVAAMQLGEDNVEPQLLLTFEGRVNRSQERRIYCVAMSPRDAFDNLTGGVMDVIENALQRAPAAASDTNDDSDTPEEGA
jgi:hypothetical protein